jgi:hypothetical protein
VFGNDLFSFSVLQPAASSALSSLTSKVITTMDFGKRELAVIPSTNELGKESFGHDVNDELDELGAISAMFRGTEADQRDMIVLGKKQVLRVCVLTNVIPASQIDPN